MMTHIVTQELSAIEQIRKLEARIQELREEQLRELTERREELQIELRSIDKEIAAIVGNNLPAETLVETVTRKHRGRRLRRVDDAPLKAEILKAMAERGATGMSIPEISVHIGHNAQHIRAFLASNPKILKRQGEGRGTRYFLP